MAESASGVPVLAFDSPVRDFRYSIRTLARTPGFSVVLGLATSATATRLIRSLFYGTQPLDPVVFVVVTVGLLAVAAVALAPAWRASIPWKLCAPNRERVT